MRKSEVQGGIRALTEECLLATEQRIGRASAEKWLVGVGAAQNLGEGTAAGAVAALHQHHYIRGGGDG
jgi:hypothetical protein